MRARDVRRRRWLSCAPLLLPLAVATACVPTFEDNLALIDGPKVLSVQAEPAEVAPGAQVQLTGLTARADPSSAAPDLLWGLCIARKPLTELGPVNPACIHAPSQAPQALVPLGSGESVQAVVPMDACRLFGPSLPEPMNGQPAGRPVDPDPTGGFYQPISVTLQDTGVTTLGAVRIFCPPSGLDQIQAGEFNANYRVNQTPILDSVAALNDSGAFEALPDEPSALLVLAGHTVHFRSSWSSCPKVAVCGDGVCGAREDKNSCAADCTAAVGCSGAESYVVFNADSRKLETHQESMRVSWFASAGHFENAVTGRDEGESLTTSDNTWTAPSNTGEVRLWLVLRDARGGQSFRRFTLLVQ